MNRYKTPFGIRCVLSISVLIITVAGLLCVTGCAGAAPASPAKQAAAADPAATPESAPSEQSFILSPGDKIKITVFGDEDLTGEYAIDGRGYITMPLAGDIQAGGKSIADLQDSIGDQLQKGYLVNPKVSIDIVSLQPFYIAGEVRTPGSYPTVPNLDVFKAIATAGGLTPRAVKNKYVIVRGAGAQKQHIAANDDTPVLPGDSIKVDERFF